MCLCASVLVLSRFTNLFSFIDRLETEFLPRAFLIDAEQEFLGVDDIACMTSEVEVLHIHSDGVNRTGFGAETAEAAAQDVDVEPLGELLDVGVGRLTGGDVDAVAGADSLAEHTSGATHRAVLLDGQTVTTTPAVGNGALDFGILVGRRSDFSLAELFQTEGFGYVERHIAPEVGVGDPEAADDFDPVDLLRDADVHGDGGDFFVHCM